MVTKDQALSKRAEVCESVKPVTIHMKAFDRRQERMKDPLLSPTITNALFIMLYGMAVRCVTMLF